MYAAIAFFLRKTTGLGEFYPAYKDTPYQEISKKLFRYNKFNLGNMSDKKAIDKWAKKLGLEGWYGLRERS